MVPLAIVLIAAAYFTPSVGILLISALQVAPELIVPARLHVRSGDSSSRRTRNPLAAVDIRPQQCPPRALGLDEAVPIAAAILQQVSTSSA